MKVAILSDIHDNIWNVEKVLPCLQGAEIMIFCGDFCAPFTLQMLGEGFRGAIHAVLGNNDGDPLLLSFIASKFAHIKLYNGMGSIEADGKKLAFAHYPQIGEALARCGLYHAAFSGHTHQRKLEIFQGVVCANPGEVMGRFGEPSFGLYDTASGAFRFEEI